MKKYLTAIAAAGLLAGGPAFADAGAALAQSQGGTAPAIGRTDSPADAKQVDIQKRKEGDDERLSLSFSIWEGWGYQKENPYFGTSIYFSPAFKLTSKQTISAFVGLSTEYTGPDDGRRVYWSNTFLSYSYRLWAPKLGEHRFQVGLGGQVILPTDEGARKLNTMRLAVGPLLRGSWAYGMLSLSARVSFLKYFNESQEQQLTEADSPTFRGIQIQTRPGLTTGRATPNYQILSVLGLNLQFTKKLYFDTQIWIINQVPYTLADDGTRSANAQSVTRDSYWAFGEIGYQFTKIFSLGFGFSLSASQLSPDGRGFYLPFNNYNNNFSTYVSATFTPSL